MERFTGKLAFWSISSGQLVSSVGSGMTRFGLSLWVLTETGDVAAYTALLFFAFLPIGLGPLIAGPVVDRLDRRSVMLTANTIASTSTLATTASLRLSLPTALQGSRRSGRPIVRHVQALVVDLVPLRVAKGKVLNFRL